jgi:hypothetical protein
MSSKEEGASKMASKTKTLGLWVAFSFLWATAGCTASQTQNPTGGAEVSIAPDVARADAKATEALATLPGLLNRPANGAPLALGEAFPIYFVDQASLGQYDKTSAADGLLQSAGRLYPVKENGQIVGSVVMHEIDGEWRPDIIGLGADGVAEPDALRAQLRQSHKADGDSYGIVNVHALHEQYMVHREQAVAYLTRVGGAAAPGAAAEVMGDLVERARTAPGVQ